MNNLKNLWETIKTEKTIIITLVILFAFGVVCWLFWTPAKEFGLNFFTEILGAAITVFILDRLIKAREDKRNIPQKLAAYEDVRLYVSRYISFWTQTYTECVPEPQPEDITLFFSDQGMSKILNHLYMDSEPNVTPPRKWWDWIPHKAKEFKDNGDKILNRHYSNLDPEAYGYIHQLTESSFNEVLLMIPTIKQTDILYNTPRVKVLGSYSIEPQKEDYLAILGLIKWCENAYSKLHRHNPTLKKIATYIPNNAAEFRPMSMIPEEVRQKEMNECIEFRHKIKQSQNLN